MLNLQSYFRVESPFCQHLLVNGDARRAQRIRDRFSIAVGQRWSDSLSCHMANYQGHGYYTLIRQFSRSNHAYYAFRVESYNPVEVLVESLWFEYSATQQVKNTLANMGGVMGNIGLGLFTDRNIFTEIDLVRRIGRTVTGGGPQRVETKFQPESEWYFQSLNNALSISLNQPSNI
jgi:hypothetical protein